MSGRQVIGVDAGGTKLLTGVVDEGLTVHHRGRRLWRGGGPEEVLDTIADAVEEALRAAPRAEAVGFGIPSLVDVGRGVSLSSVHPLPPSREGVEIVPAALAEESGMLGAAQLALDLAGAGAVPEEARPS